jgi:signal transduction histidine kinase
VQWVRVGFLVASVLGGFGVLLYAGLWMVLPEARHFGEQAPGIDAATRQGKRPSGVARLVDAGPLVALGAIALGLLVLVATLTGQMLIWPALLALGGVAFLWWQADEAQRERWRDSTARVSPLGAVVGSGGWAAYARVAAGIVLLVVAIVVVSVRSGGWGVALEVGTAALLGILGLGFIAGPWLYRLSTDLQEERAERIRSQERADVAAHLHDSVLQTLALIQRSAGDSAAVSRLARAQERDLRTWLYDDPTTGPTTLAAALRQVAAEIEDGTGVPVEVVDVGDGPVGERGRPLVLATREAVLNAAKHSGAAKVDVYAEVVGGRAEVFVRDRGNGFDPAAVAADRHGVRDSIVDRMERHGGTATVTSSLGQGTEVRLSMDLSEGASS